VDLYDCLFIGTEGQIRRLIREVTELAAGGGEVRIERSRCVILKTSLEPRHVAAAIARRGKRERAT